jgi:hypothetical protein
MDLRASQRSLSPRYAANLDRAKDWSTVSREAESEGGTGSYLRLRLDEFTLH